MMKLRDLLLIAQQELFDLDNTIKDIRLEQAVFNQKENLWEVVISYLVDNKNKINNLEEIKNNSFLTISSMLPFERIYKMLKIDENKIIKGFYIYQKSS